MTVALLLVLWGGIVFGAGHRVGKLSAALEGDGVKLCPGESVSLDGTTVSAQDTPIVIRRKSP